MNRKTKVALALIAGLAMVFGAAPTALAQNDPSNIHIPTLELQDADVREALRALFRNVGVSYTIAPEVQGNVTVSLRDQTFEVCLRNILNQVDATYRVEGGVYQIIKRENTPTPGSGDNNTTTTTTQTTKITRRIRINHADPQLIALLIGSENGNQSYSTPPELTTVANTQSSGGQGSGGFGGGMGGGGLGGGGFGGGGLGGGGFGGGGGGFGGGGGRGGRG